MYRVVRIASRNGWVSRGVMFSRALTALRHRTAPHRVSRQQTCQAAADSAVSDSLWAPLVAAEFSDQEQHAMLFARPAPEDAQGPAAGVEGSAGDAGGEALDGTASSRGVSSPKSGKKNSGSVRANRQKLSRKGASRCLYAKLHSARVRRAAIAAEQRRRMTIFEMSALGRLGRTWGLYPWAPYLPRGPYHFPGSALPEHNWDGSAAGAGGGNMPPEELHGAAPGFPPHPMWGVGWGRRASAWRTFGAGAGGAAGAAGCGVVFGETGGVNGAGMGVPPPSYGVGVRRGRGRFLGQVSGL